MIRNFRALGLAVVAMLAIGAVMASSASAVTGHLTSPNGPVSVVGVGEDIGTSNPLTAFSGEIECHHSTYAVAKTGTTSNEHLQLPASSATVTPTYTGCTQGAETATVTMNGCNYDFTFTDGKVALVCPTGKVVEVHRYGAEPHGSSTCTTTVKPTQEVSASHVYTTSHTVSGVATPEIGTVTYTNGVADDIVEVHGTVTGITAQAHGNCSFGLTLNTSTASIHVNARITAQTTAGVGVPVHIG